jgi:hypothetical protein
MRLGSDWLVALANSETDAERARITSIFSHHDNDRLPGTHGLARRAQSPLDRLGHVSLLRIPRASPGAPDCAQAHRAGFAAQRLSAASASSACGKRPDIRDVAVTTPEDSFATRA